MSIQVADICGYYGVHIWRFLRQSKFGSVAGPGVRVGSRTDLKPQTFYVRSHLKSRRSTGRQSLAHQNRDERATMNIGGPSFRVCLAKMQPVRHN
jgi:hypothetical protein